MRLKIMSTGMLLLWLLIACAAPVEVEVAEENTVEGSEVANTAEPPPAPQAADDATALPATLIPEPPATALPTPTKASLAASLPRISKAPDITNETWLNSEPMTLAGQEGKVVLVEFWTYT